MRMLLAIIKILLLLGAALWVANQSGQVTLTWGDHIVETSLATASLAALVVLFVMFMLYRGWRFIIDGWRQWRMGKKIHQLQRGQEDLTWALTALAGGDTKEANRAATRARKKLGATPLVGFLQAQVARATGDDAKARALFQQMLLTPEGTLLGYRGLLTLAMRQGDWVEVERLITKLQDEKIDMPWLSTVTYQLSLQRQDWAEAHRALSYAISANQVNEAANRVPLATLLLVQADEAAADGRTAVVLDYAEEALRLDPCWVPAQLAIIQQHLKMGHIRAAGKAAEKFLRLYAHPEIVALYRQTHHQENALHFYQRLSKVLRSHENEPAALRALAATAMDADLWGEARRLLQDVLQRNQASIGDYQLLAKIERRETGNEAAAAAWLAQSVTAHADATWVCTACGTSHLTWQSSCTACGQFATVAWREPSRMGSDVPKAVTQSSPVLPWDHGSDL